MEKMPRKTSVEELGELKGATRSSMEIVGGKRFSLVTRVLPPALSDYGSIAAPKDFMPVDVLVDLQKEFGCGIASPLLEEIARLSGFRLVPLDDDDAGSELGLGDVQTLMREGGEGEAAALGALGASDLNAVREARREVSEGKRAFAQVERKLARRERNLMRRRA